MITKMGCNGSSELMLWVVSLVTTLQLEQATCPPRRPRSTPCVCPVFLATELRIFITSRLLWMVMVMDMVMVIETPPCVPNMVVRCASSHRAAACINLSSARIAHPPDHAVAYTTLVIAATVVLSRARFLNGLSILSAPLKIPLVEAMLVLLTGVLARILLLREALSREALYRKVLSRLKSISQSRTPTTSTTRLRLRLWPIIMLRLKPITRPRLKLRNWLRARATVITKCTRLVTKLRVMINLSIKFLGSTAKLSIRFRSKLSTQLNTQLRATVITRFRAKLMTSFIRCKSRLFIRPSTLLAVTFKSSPSRLIITLRVTFSTMVNIKFSTWLKMALMITLETKLMIMLIVKLRVTSKAKFSLTMNMTGLSRMKITSRTKLRTSLKTRDIIRLHRL